MKITGNSNIYAHKQKFNNICLSMYLHTISTEFLGKMTNLGNSILERTTNKENQSDYALIQGQIFSILLFPLPDIFCLIPVCLYY